MKNILKQHKDDYSGYWGLVVQEGEEHLSGYVALPKGHPKFGAIWNEFEDINIHKGIVYATDIHPTTGGACPSDYWVGFTVPLDDVHVSDHYAHLIPFGYREKLHFVYVEGMVEYLARQLFDLVNPPEPDKEPDIIEFLIHLTNLTVFQRISPEGPLLHSFVILRIVSTPWDYIENNKPAHKETWEWQLVNVYGGNDHVICSSPEFLDTQEEAYQGAIEFLEALGFAIGLDTEATQNQ